MKLSTFEAVTHAENALACSNQALAVLDLWMDSLKADDEAECNRVAAVHSLVHQALEHLHKAAEVKDA